MRLDEFENTMDNEGTVEDVIIYMRNDPMVYRKSLFPAIMKMKDLYDKKKNVNADQCLGKAVESSMLSYCGEFGLGSPKNVFKNGDKKAIIDKLYAEEMTQIKKGVY